MAKGRPPKRKRNITGLRNQSKPSPEQDTALLPPLHPRSGAAKSAVASAASKHDQCLDECWVRETLTGVAQWFGYDAEEEENEICEDEWEEEWFDCEELEEKMFSYAAAIDDSGCGPLLYLPP
ncbi:hypothetical protein D9757_010011 [Collybiopsis confluens]|uniref:Uncharacterized protein n=1 Tax=Collybiopsis confluens TaxID=2823264 RepID=A0A8H5GUC9_9AGAR|nr:hypothetical protein D9757_010011 [Collybiopsis confluens]